MRLFHLTIQNQESTFKYVYQISVFTYALNKIRICIFICFQAVWFEKKRANGFCFLFFDSQTLK